MKKYIAPVARNINFETESIIALSNIGEEGDGLDLSNKREHTVSEQIWGFEEENESMFF